MKFLKAIAASLVLSTANMSPALADRVSLLLGSYHFDASGFEEFNPGVFYTWEHSRVGYSVGGFRNSYGRGAVAGTVSLPFFRWDSGEFSIFAGAAYYPEDGSRIASQITGDVIAIGGLQLRQGYTFFQLIPLDDRGADAVLSYGLTFPVKK